MDFTRSKLSARRAPVWLRLVVLAIVPLVGMASVAIPLLRDRMAAADRSKAISEHVAELRVLVTLESALDAEAAPTELTLRSAQFGLTTGQAAALIGIDVVSRLRDSRAQTDALIEELARYDAPIADDLRATTSAWRTSFDRGDATVASFHAAYLAANARLAAVGDAQADLVSQAAASAGGQVPGVEAAARRLVDAYALEQAGRAQTNALFVLTVPGAGTDPMAARRDLAAAQALYRAQLAVLNRAAPAAESERIRALADDPDARTVDDTTTRLVSTTATYAFGELASLFRAGFAWTDRIIAVVDVVAAGATSAAADSRRDTERQLRTSMMLFAGLAGGAAMLAVVIARSITRRLKPLAERAAAISEGVLAGDDADERGPREIAVVARALNDTVANLRQVDEQAQALARGDLDAPVLGTPAGGALGASIHDTFHRLAEAWRERDDLQQRLAHQANHDLLTSLPNRKAALESLSAALARAERHGDAVAVLFVDLDEFKRINDTYGHHVGDRTLALAAGRLAAAIRAGDTLARLGGDEFVVVGERLGDPRSAVELAERLIAAVSEPFEVNGLTVQVGASVGIGLALDGRSAPLDLLRDADHAVHRAKRVGKGRVEIFDEAARDALEASTQLELDLRRALADGDLVLHYQPIADTVTGEVLGFEALARWTRDGRPVSPADFVAVAEQSDLVNDLGRWALATATTQLRTWTDSGRYVDAYIAVNISGRHLLHSSFLTDVHDALHASGLDPARLVVEITETVVLGDLAGAATVLSDLRARGVRVALDDFGTGYTSIAHLWRLPVDVLKIDGAFVRRLGTTHEHVLVELIIDVAHTLGLGLVAECVETVEQLDALRALACDAVQGYLVARPQAADHIDRLPVPG